jgi:hypothetical protein
VKKGLDFGVFVVLGFGVFLAEILRFLLIQRVLVDHNLALERIGRSGVGFEGVDPWVLLIPSCPGYTGLTSALDRSDRCEPFVGFASGEVPNSCVVGLCWCWFSS